MTSELLIAHKGRCSHCCARRRADLRRTFGSRTHERSLGSCRPAVSAEHLPRPFFVRDRILCGDDRRTHQLLPPSRTPEALEQPGAAYPDTCISPTMQTRSSGIPRRQRQRSGTLIRMRSRGRRLRSHASTSLRSHSRRAAPASRRRSRRPGAESSTARAPKPSLCNWAMRHSR